LVRNQIFDITYLYVIMGASRLLREGENHNWKPGDRYKLYKNYCTRNIRKNYFCAGNQCLKFVATNCEFCIAACIQAMPENSLILVVIYARYV